MPNVLHPCRNVKTVKVHGKSFCAFISVFNVFICLMARAESDEVKRLEADPIIEEGSPRRWALATDAIHSTLREAGLDRLRWGAATKANIEYVRKDLEQGPWRIRSRADVLESLKTTQTDSYSKMFLELGEYLSKLSEAERVAYAAKQNDDPKVLNRIKIATEQYPRLKNKGLLAWDLARCVALCRRAYTVGFLEREEAWTIIMPIALKIQTVFDSWEDLGIYVARQFYNQLKISFSGTNILE